MAEESDEIKQLKQKLADLEAKYHQLHRQFAVTHNLVIALAQQCNSPDILRANFAEVSDATHDRLLNSLTTDDDIADLGRIQALVDKQLPGAPRQT